MNFETLLLAAAPFLALIWAILAYVMIRLGFWHLRDNAEHRGPKYQIVDIGLALTSVLYSIMALAGICLIVPDSIVIGFASTCGLLLTCFIADRLWAISKAANRRKRPATVDSAGIKTCRRDGTPYSEPYAENQHLVV